ncbi:MAG: flagellar type III secretion system pore protein FliP [Candidatus Berkiella sp.]
MKRIIFLLLLIPVACWAGDFNFDAFSVSNDGHGAQKYSVNLQLIALMTVLTLLPAIILMMTSFTRIIIVLSILRQALGMPQTPSNQIIIGLSLFLTMFIMAPVYNEVHETAIKPYSENKISQDQALKKASVPVKQFMFNQTRSEDLDLFLEISNTNLEFKDAEHVPLSILISAFITSELKTAFQIGFIIFIPFLIIDLVVASVLMSMGMMMLSPLIISLPFKIMLFVLVDGWNLIIGTLASSFALVGT